MCKDCVFCEVGNEPVHIMYNLDYVQFQNIFMDDNVGCWYL